MDRQKPEIRGRVLASTDGDAANTVSVLVEQVPLCLLILALRDELRDA